MTTLREKVFAVTKTIPSGKTMTYKEVAQKIGNPRAYRAVANALATNHDKSIPCHRVIRSDGGMGGYSMGGIKRKVEILKKEGALK